MAIKARPGENLDSMLRRFKKEVLNANIMTDLRRSEFYVSPSEKKRKKSAEARKRAARKANKPI